MAFFGDLEHHALTDLVRVLRTQTGTLYFHQAYEGRTLELTLAEGHLCALYMDGFPVDDLGRVRHLLSELQQQNRGAFEFQPQPAPGHQPLLYRVPFSSLIQELNVAPIPESQLPHAETRFVLSPSGAQVPPSLAAVWQDVLPHLHRGSVSAADLAHVLARPEADLQAALYRLRAVDLITPQRAAQPLQEAPRPGRHDAPLPSHPATVAPAGAGVNPPLVRRLLGALRRLTGASL